LVHAAERRVREVRVRRGTGRTGRLAAAAACALLVSAGLTAIGGAAQTPPPADGAAWRFAVSGDSRNCGDVVMPAIAAGVLRSGAAFYWHLGDFRKIYDFDEDMSREHSRAGRTLTISGYESLAFDDFIRHQLAPFGALPVRLAFGNHEMIEPKSRAEVLIQFADWLTSPPLRAQRLADNPDDHRLRGYYRWIERGVDFITLDNATPDQFDANQVSWLRGAVARDIADPSIKAIVVGMHKALPDSIAADHSMNESPVGEQSGRAVYRVLLDARDKGKHVYALASHSHFYMDGIFATSALRALGDPLPGWIVGTAGAVRYRLPTGVAAANEARTNVYGYLVGDVSPTGEIRFTFHDVQPASVPDAVTARYGDDFVRWCFEKNSLAEPAPPRDESRPLARRDLAASRR
jgi:hypothetical protein